MAPSSDEVERQQRYDEFRRLGFTTKESRVLAEAWADPVRVSWWLEQGCPHKTAVNLAT